MTGAFENFRGNENERGLLENVTEKWNLVDWPENLRDGYDFPLTNPIGNGVHNVINAFWIGFLKAFDALSGIMGLPVTGKAEKTEKSYIEAFYNEETGLFCDTPAKKTFGDSFQRIAAVFRGKKERSRLREKRREMHRRKTLDVDGRIYVVFRACRVEEERGRRKSRCACHG